MKSSEILLIHPTGNENVRAALKGLNQKKLLSFFFTTIASFPNNIFGNISYLPGLSEFKRRAYPAELKSKTILFPQRELGRLFFQRLGLKALTRHELGYFSIDQVIQSLDSKVATLINSGKIPISSALYAYEDGAINSFLAAKNHHISCLYDLPIGYWRAAHELLALESDRWPDWAVTMPTFKDSAAKLERKDQELQLADSIFVASTFTKKTLSYYPGSLAPVSVVPYGFPPINTTERLYYNGQCDPLKLLFVGSLSQRKGIANLLAAVAKFPKSVQLTIVGHLPLTVCKPLDQALKKHRYISSLPHEKILKLMREHDVLVFPSLFEGFGLVISESMSQATPVITTDRTAGPDLIVHGENGWMVEAASTEGIVEVLEHLLAHPDEIEKCGRAALLTASKRPWSIYGSELAEKISSIIF